MIPNRIGIKEIAEHAGVSVATVFNCLTDRPGVGLQTKQRIQELSRKLGYHPLRQSLASKSKVFEKKELRFGFLSVGTDEGSLSRSPLGLQTVQLGIRMEFQVIKDIEDDQTIINRTLEFARGLDGIILSGKVSRRLLNSLQKKRVPHVIYGFPSEYPEESSNFCRIVTSDMIGMGRLATKTLIKTGHTRIAFLCQALPKNLWADRWLQGYQWALGENHLRFDPHLLKVSAENFTAEKQALELLALKNRPTAFVLPEVGLGSSFLAILKSHGIKIPVESVVFGATDENIRKHGLTLYPWIGHNIESFALVALKQLTQITTQQMPCSLTICIPILSKNLPVSPN
jgi:LacI family transcriptional regulator